MKPKLGKLTRKEPKSKNARPKSREAAEPWENAYMIDIDGVVCDHVDNEFPEKMKTVEEIAGAKDWINSKFDEGNYICFFTARLESHRAITEKWLRDHGFKYHKVIFGKPRGGNYHYIDRAHVRATTFKGRYTPMVSEVHGIEVFQDES